MRLKCPLPACARFQTLWMPRSAAASRPLSTAAAEGEQLDDHGPSPADNASSYVMMSNIYAETNRWDEVRNIQNLRRSARAWKKPGRAFIEVQNQTHDFVVGDRTHIQTDNIQEKMRRVKKAMNSGGYIPNVELVLELLS